jgi:serine/threonine protein phosphatase PrpC
MSASRPLSFSWAVTTDKGLRRTSNEDSHCERSDIGLFVVADGMGGHVAGEVASREAVDAIQAFINDTASADKNRTWPFPFEPNISFEANRLKSAFRLANRRIAAAIADSSDLRGMATTASAFLAGTSSACVAHVGDSRVYRLRNGELSQLTHDHSWVEEQVRAGTMSASAARQHPWRNVVTRALSGGEDPEVDVTEVEPVQGDRYLLCSDGLFSVVTDQQIAEILGDQQLSLQQICTSLIAAANAGGGPDNITALVLEVNGRADGGPEVNGRADGGPGVDAP